MRSLLLGVVMTVQAAGGSGLGLASPAGAVRPATVFEVHDAASHDRVLRIEETSSLEQGLVKEERTFKTNSDGLAGAEAVHLTAGSRELQSYWFEDHSTGERSELEVSGTTATARYRAAKSEEGKTKELAWGPSCLTGNLLPSHILKHWAALQSGAEVAFDLFVPFRLETVGFRLIKSAVSPDHKTVTVTAEASNWLIRQFAPAIAFEFSQGTPPQLLKYTGPAPVKFDSGKTKAVVIDFRSAPLAAR